MQINLNFIIVENNYWSLSYYLFSWKIKKHFLAARLKIIQLFNVY